MFYDHFSARSLLAKMGKTVDIDLGSMTEWFRSNKLSLSVSKTRTYEHSQ